MADASFEWDPKKDDENQSKHGVSFADILRTAQRVLAPVEVLDLVKQHKDLRESRRPLRRSRRRSSGHPRTARIRLAG